MTSVKILDGLSGRAAKLTHDDPRRALAGLRERNLPVCTRKPCECEETGERPDLCRMTTRQ